MMSLKAGQYLLLFSDTFDGDMDLSLASVGGMLGVGDSTFKGVKMGGLRVPHLAMTDGATFVGDVNLSLASIGGQLVMSGSTFKGDVDLGLATVGGTLNFSGATFHRNVNLAGATVAYLLLGSTKDPRPQWDPGSRLILLNTKVGGLRDRIDKENGQDHDAWPDSLELDTFVYGRLSGVGEDEQAKRTNRDTAWYLRWIKRNLSFSPQPYRQLAKVFQEMGYPEKAEDILYAARAEERSRVWVRREYLSYSFVKYDEQRRCC